MTVKSLFCARIETDMHDEGRTFHYHLRIIIIIISTTTTTTCSEPIDGHLKTVRRSEDLADARRGQKKRNGLGEGLDVLGPVFRDALVVPVGVQVELCAAEVRGCAEESVAG